MITLALLSITIVGVVIVNSMYQGSFVVGLLVIALPVMFLAYLLPLIVPVKCQKCNGSMRFRFNPQRDRPVSEADNPNLYEYVCQECSATYP